MKNTEQIDSTEQEEIGSLEGRSPIELVPLVEETGCRTFDCKDVVIAYLDTPQYQDRLLDWGENPLPVIDSSGFRIGWASIRLENPLEGDRRILLADIFADYYTPDRLTVETQAYPIYAYPVGMAGSHIVNIFAVKLDTGKPEDNRLTSLCIT